MDKVMHFEIPADNIERAKKFYSSIFGWQLVDVPEMGGYVMARTAPSDEKGMVKEKGAINGGIMKRGDSAFNPVIVANVSDIDKSIEKIKIAGGQIVMSTQNVGDMGLYARFKDIDGNIIGVWQELKKNG